MGRYELRQEIFREFFGITPGPASDIVDIYRDYIFGEVWQAGQLSPVQREMIAWAIIAAQQIINDIPFHVDMAAKVGLEPEQIHEIVSQSAPFIGLSRMSPTLNAMTENFREKGIEISLQSQKTVTEATRLEEGLKLQKKLFGDAVDALHLPEPIAGQLAALGVGDFFTRRGVSLEMRILLAFVTCVSLGKSEKTLAAFALANRNVGNDKSLLLDTLVQCIPYVGFPNVLDAVACVNEAFA